MKIGIDKAPNIMQIVFRAEQSDKFYSNCMWGVVNLDLKNGIMSACTECGDYTYKRPEKGKEFLKRMKHISEEYLLERVSSVRFDYELTVLGILEYFEEEYEDEKYFKAVSFFDKLDTISGGLDFYNTIQRRDSEELFLDLDIDSFLVYDYPSNVRTFAKLFVKYVQHKIEV